MQKHEQRRRNSTSVTLALCALRQSGTPARPCRVSFTDASGITHAAEVTADSLYEAVALALRDLRSSSLVPALPGPATPIHVRVLANSEAKHSIRFSQFEAWLLGTAPSPKERLVKDRPTGLVGGRVGRYSRIL